MKMKKTQTLAFLLLVALMASIFGASSSAIGSQWKQGYNYIDNTIEKNLNSREIADFEKYKLDLEALSSLSAQKTTSVTDLILSFCSKVSTTLYESDFSDLTNNIYQSDVLYDYLFDCEEITEISKSTFTRMGNMPVTEKEEDFPVDISYLTRSGIEVILAYGPGGLLNMAVYFGDTDTVVLISDEENKRIENFRYGTYTVITEEFERVFQEASKSGNYDALYEFDGVLIFENEDGSVDVDSDDSVLVPLYPPDYVESSVLVDPPNKICYGSQSRS